MTPPCTVCGLPVDLEDCHQVHVEGCARRAGDGTCTCDGVAHPDCCPECREAVA